MSACYSAFAKYMKSFSSETEIEPKVRYSIFKFGQNQNSAETKNLASFGAEAETKFRSTSNW